MVDSACRLSGRKALPISAEQEWQIAELMRQDDAREAAPASTSSHPEPGPAIVEDAAPSLEPFLPLVAIPELSHPGESQSNGSAEVAVKNIVSRARTLKVALEARLRLKTHIPCSHAIVHWLFEHASWILSTFMVDGEGRTPYGRLHGREVRERVCEFGERVMFYLQKTRAVQKWMLGGQMVCSSAG